MPSKGRQPYVATVHGEIDGVPFTNYFKFLASAMRNCRDDDSFVLTVIETGHRYAHTKNGWKSLSFNAPLLAIMESSK